MLFAGGLLLLSAVTSNVFFLLAGALIGLGFGNMQSTTQAIAVKTVNHDRVGIATSTYYIALDAGLGFGPYVLGYIIPITGYSRLYFLLGIMILITTGLYYLLHGRKKKSAAAKEDFAVQK